MRRHPHHNPWRLMLWILVSSLGLGTGQVSRVGTGQDSPVDLFVGSSLDPEKYRGQVAKFGNQLPRHLFATNLNLILPPANQSHLCEFFHPPQTQPELFFPDYENENSTNESLVLDQLIEQEEMEDKYGHLINRESTTVALFVSYGECLPQRKAEVALSLQRNYTRYGTVTHLIIYNNDLSHMDELHTLVSYTQDENVSDMSIVFVSTRSGQDIMESIEDEERRQRIASPRLFEDGNEFWFLPVSFLEPRPHEPYPGSTGAGYSDIGPYSDLYDNNQYPPPMSQDHGLPTADDFYWFRLAIFSLLVVSPCFRAAYLWYAGGARIRLRYNEQGRLVGLQYIPPMPFWFAPRPDENYTQPASRMTRAQVMALPEIEYEPTPREEFEPPQPPPPKEGGHRNEAGGDTEAMTTTGPKESSTNAGTTSVSSGNTTPLAASSDGGDLPSLDTDEEQGAPMSPSDMHTTCSICIEDFEEGERLRLLPRCRHIFHTECILPWLTERQGCCPYCKTEVLEPENEHASNPEDRRRQHAQHSSFHNTQEQPLGQLHTTS